MPQIDFGQAFSTANEGALSIPPHGESIQLDSVLPVSKRRTPRILIRFGQQEWANLIFAVVTFGGGLFCAFYFFNGAELLRAVSGWSREFLYPRPSITAQSATDASQRDADVPASQPAVSRDHSGDPFSRSA